MVARTYKERVARGAALLDELAPGWHKQIDLNTLKLSSCTDCVCGQLAYATANDVIDREIYNEGSYHAWTAFRGYLSRKLKRRKKTDLAVEILEDPSHFGFSTIREGYPTLDKEWRRVIEERMEQAAQS